MKKRKKKRSEKKEQPPENHDSTMTLVGHLSELRRRLISVGVIFTLAFAVSFFFIRDIADYLLSLGLTSGFSFVYLAPSELLTSYFRLSLNSALCVSLPVILYQGWSFVAPALSNKQKGAGYGALMGGFVFFMGGMLFAYFIVLPTMVQFLVNFNTSTYITSSISVGEYLKFVVGILMTFGLIFEMPVLSLLLTTMGILQPEYMVKTRRYAILLVFIIGAIITPPDIVSQTMIALPMIVLYQLSIWVSAIAWKSRCRKEEKENKKEEFFSKAAEPA